MDNNETRFQWYCHLLLALVIFQGLASGLMIAIFTTSYLPWYPEAVNTAIWGTSEMPDEVATYSRLMCAIAGGTILAWATLMAVVIHLPFRRRELWAWWAIAVSTGSWFIVDTAVSYYLGVLPNVWFNVMAIAMLAIPLGLSKGYFTSPTSSSPSPASRDASGGP